MDGAVAICPRFERQSFGRALREFSNRLLNFSKALKARQDASVRQAAGLVHVALIAVLSAIMVWPDWRLAWRFTSGLRVMGPGGGFRGPTPAVAAGRRLEDGSAQDIAWDVGYAVQLTCLGGALPQKRIRT